MDLVELRTKHVQVINSYLPDEQLRRRFWVARRIQKRAGNLCGMGTCVGSQAFKRLLDTRLVERDPLMSVEDEKWINLEKLDQYLQKFQEQHPFSWWNNSNVLEMEREYIDSARL